MYSNAAARMDHGGFLSESASLDDIFEEMDEESARVFTAGSSTIMKKCTGLDIYTDTGALRIQSAAKTSTEG